MNSTHFIEFPAAVPPAAKTGICLHGHTLHSRENLEFLSGILARVAPLAWLAHRHCGRNSRGVVPIDFSRLWWTPPLSAHQFWEMETRRVENELGLDAVVSITDHDNLEAPLALRVLEEAVNTPVSLEWTVPYASTYFHLGVHNLPADQAHSLFAAMRAYTAAPSPAGLGDVLSELDRHREVLIVLNHALWDEKAIGKEHHRHCLEEFLDRFAERIHALEWNGFRSRRENLAVAALSEGTGIPLVAGGDSHGRQPGAVLNLTEADCMDEFAHQVRRRRQPWIAIMPEHREHLTLRILEAICEVLREDPSHGLGWIRWGDRVFYRNDAGDAVPLSRLWRASSVPLIIRTFVGLMFLIDAGLGHSQLRHAMRLALARGEEAA